MSFSLFRYPALRQGMKNVGIYRLRRAAPGIRRGRNVPGIGSI